MGLLRRISWKHMVECLKSSLKIYKGYSSWVIWEIFFTALDKELIYSVMKIKTLVSLLCCDSLILINWSLKNPIFLCIAKGPRSMWKLLFKESWSLAQESVVEKINKIGNGVCRYPSLHLCAKIWGHSREKFLMLFWGSFVLEHGLGGDSEL